MDPPPIHLDTSNNNKRPPPTWPLVTTNGLEFCLEPRCTFFFFFSFFIITNAYLQWNRLPLCICSSGNIDVSDHQWNSRGSRRDPGNSIFLSLIYITNAYYLQSLREPLPPRNSKKGPTTWMGSEGLGRGLETGRVSNQSLFFLSIHFIFGVIKMY
jgi:hypothetical protein